MDYTHAELKYYIWLSQAFPHGSNKPMQILSAVGSPKAFYEGLTESVKGLEFLNSSDQKAMMKRTNMKRCEQIIERCRTLNIKIAVIGDEEYPKALYNIFGPPIVLYYYGDITCLNQNVAIASVGSRYASDYSRTVAYKLCYDLAKCGVVIVSGCAMGIDSVSHFAALKAKGKTVGIMACGLDVNYPANTLDLRKQILKRGGALISEHPPKEKATRQVFAIRNRLMSGISVGTLIVQAEYGSGTSLTANHAVEQGKDLFIVPPHDLADKQYLGVVPYLRDGAKPVFDYTDIISEYGEIFAHKLMVLNAEQAESLHQELDRVAPNASPKTVKSKSVQSDPPPAPPLKKATNLTHAQQTIYDCIKSEPVHIEQIASESGFAYHEVVANLTTMEIMGIIKSHPGQRYSL